MNSNSILFGTSHKMTRYAKNWGGEWPLWEVLWDYGVDGRLLLAVKSLYTAQEFVSVSEALNHNRSPLGSDKGV